MDGWQLLSLGRWVILAERVQLGHVGDVSESVLVLPVPARNDVDLHLVAASVSQPVATFIGSPGTAPDVFHLLSFPSVLCHWSCGYEL